MASIMNSCDRCGSAVAPGASVCPNCGAPLGGVDSSVTGVPPETVRTDSPSGGARSGEDWPPIGTQMPVAGEPTPPKPAASPWQEALPPAGPAPAYSPRPEQQVFTAPAAAAPARRFPWPWIIGCCLAIVLLACLLSIGFGGWLLTSFSSL